MLRGVAGWQRNAIRSSECNRIAFPTDQRRGHADREDLAAYDQRHVGARFRRQQSYEEIHSPETRGVRLG